jgi:predicted secreted protein
MRLSWLGILLLGLFSTAAVAGDNPSAAVAATYRPADKKRLASSFVSAVNTWLHRYERILITQDAEHVRMQVRYDYVYDLELTVKEDRFEIKVTGSERARGTPNGQRNATNLAAGLLKGMETKKAKRNEYEDRWTRAR